MREFLSDLKVEGAESIDNLLGQQSDIQAVEPEKVPEEKRDRREVRRLKAQLQAEKESAIALAERVKVLSEVSKFRQETGGESYDDTIARIYGTNTPEAREATRLLQKALQDSSEKAVERALEIVRQEQSSSVGEVAREENNLEGMVEDIEDQFGVEMSATDRKQFFTLLERFSPKDGDGIVTDYADPFSTWEALQSIRPKSATTQRAKDLSDRSMVRSGADVESKLTDEATQRYLRENGII